LNYLENNLIVSTSIVKTVIKIKRKDFIKNTVLGLGATAIAPPVSAEKKQIKPN